jgi:hypothetical protein
MAINIGRAVLSHRKLVPVIKDLVKGHKDVYVVFANTDSLGLGDEEGGWAAPCPTNEATDMLQADCGNRNHQLKPQSFPS